MNFKFNGMGWVGGIYQKFEKLCHEVDNIVNQDTVKYVENQAPIVGKTMKRFCSDVMHDILPPLKHEGQEGSDIIDTYVKSKAAIAEDHIETVGSLSHVVPIAVYPFEKQLEHASNEPCLSDQLSTLTSVDALEGAESDIMSGQVTGVLKNTSSDVNIKENAIMEKTSLSEVLKLISPCEEESFGASLANEFIDFNKKSSCVVVDEVSHTISVHDTEFQLHQKEGAVNNNIAIDLVKNQIDCAFSELCILDQLRNPNSVDSLLGTEYTSSNEVADVLKDMRPKLNTVENAIMEKPFASGMAGLISPAEKKSFGALLLSECIDCNDKETCEVEAMVSPETSVNDVTKPFGADVPVLISPGKGESFGASLVDEFVTCNDKNPCVVCTDGSPATLVHCGQNVRTAVNDFVDDANCVSDTAGDITSSRMTSPVIHCEENMAKVGVGFSSGSVLKEYCLPETSPENSPAKALLYHDPIDMARSVSHNVHSSPTLTPLLSNEKKSTGTVSISSSNDLSMESLENDASRTVHSIEPPTGRLRNKNVYFGGESARFQALSSSDIGPMDDINISSMETIELGSEVKLEDSCVIVDHTALYAISRIMRKHRSYKKMIQDALTSKKRRGKEYEQLAIWFGDADMGSNHSYKQTLRSCSSGTTLDCKHLQTDLISDSEWELL